MCVCCVRLASESVERASLSLESVDDVHGSDGLPLGVFRVGHGISDDVLKEDLEDPSSLLVDEARDTLDTSSTGETTDGRLRDPLDVVSQDFPMTLGSSFPQTLSSLSSAGHDESCEFLLLDETRE